MCDFLYRAEGVCVLMWGEGKLLAVVHIIICGSQLHATSWRARNGMAHLCLSRE